MNSSEYSIQERTDDILDKILKYGIDSLRSEEKKFLDSYATDEQEKFHNKLCEINRIFEDDYFKFEHYDTRKYQDEIHFIGVLHVPNLFVSKTKKVEGRLEGRIIVYKNGQVSPDFKTTDEKREYDIFEFCGGLEYELDSFLDYVISELNILY